MTRIEIGEKYERNHWPSLARPDLKPPAGWSLSLITSVNRVRNHQLSPAGGRIAFIWDREDQSDVYVMDAAGGWPGQVSTNRALVAYWDDEVPQWSPDGQWLAFTIEGHVHVVPAGGGIPQKISDFAPGASSPVWMPDSRQVLVTVTRDDKDQLVLTDRDGGWPRGLAEVPGDAWEAQPAPDGRFVAFTHRPFDDLNRLDVWLVEVETGHIREVAGAPKEKNWNGRWSPDGSQLAFLSQRSGWNDVWLARPDTGEVERLTNLGADVADIAWSPDGRCLAGTVNRDGAFELALIDAGSGEVTTLGSGKGYYSRPNWSPAGEYLTVEYEDATRPPDLYRVEVPSGRMAQLTFSNPPALAQNAMVVPERMSYRSYDGLEIPAFLYRPVRPNGAAILYPHGGPSAQYTHGWDILAQYFVAKGYTYLAPNYRGSTGYGVEFEQANYGDWGVGDTQDCLYGATYLQELEWIERDRVGIYGPSYGGYMVACCLSRDPEYRFACGVSKYGEAHTLTSWAQCNRHLRLYSEIFLGHPAQNR